MFRNIRNLMWLTGTAVQFLRAEQWGSYQAWLTCFVLGPPPAIFRRVRGVTFDPPRGFTRAALLFVALQVFYLNAAVFFGNAALILKITLR